MCIYIHIYVTEILSVQQKLTQHCNSTILQYKMGFLGVSDSEESACNAGDPGVIPGSGRSPGEGNGYPL